MRKALHFTDLAAGDYFWFADRPGGLPYLKLNAIAYESEGYRFCFYPGKDRDPRTTKVVRAILVGMPGEVTRWWESEPETEPHPKDSLHSGMDAAGAIAEARRLGDPSEGDGWRRLLFRMATLLEQSHGNR